MITQNAKLATRQLNRASKGIICPLLRLQYPWKGAILLVSRIYGRSLRICRTQRCTIQLVGLLGRVSKKVGTGSPGHTTILASSRHCGTLLSLGTNSKLANGEHDIVILSLKGRACVTFVSMQKMPLDENDGE